MLSAIPLCPKMDHVVPGEFASHVAALLSVRPDRVESAGELLVLVFLFLGYLAGWALNGIFLAAAGKYSASQAFQIIAKGKVPATWQNEKAGEIMADAEQKLSERRAFATRMGPLRFIVRGTLFTGIVGFLTVHVGLNVIQSQPIVLASLPWKLGLWIVFGAGNAVWAWYEQTRPEV